MMTNNPIFWKLFFFFDASDFQLYLYLNQNCSKMRESIGVDHKKVIDIHCKLLYMLDAAVAKCF